MEEKEQNQSGEKPFGAGQVQIYTGEGKGKTSAALGTVVRALGQGLRVCIVVFMKGRYPYSEWAFLSRIEGVHIERFGLGSFVDKDSNNQEAVAEARKALAYAREAMLSGKYDLLVLDEVNIASAWKLIDVEEVVRLIKDRPAGLELVLTGRYADERLIELADLATECRKIKHPFDKGLRARRGMDY